MSFLSSPLIKSLVGFLVFFSITCIFLGIILGVLYILYLCFSSLVALILAALFICSLIYYGGKTYDRFV